MSKHDKNLLWFGFQLGTRLALYEAGVNDRPGQFQKRIELLRKLRDGEISITDPEPRHPGDALTPVKMSVVDADRSLAKQILEDYQTVAEETSKIAGEIDKDGN